MSKRKNPDYTGYIRQRKNGTWEGQYLYDGVLKSVYGKTEPDVREKINKIYADILAGTFIGGSKDTVAFWLNKWLKEYAQPTVRPSTYTNYETNIRGHVVPSFGHIKMKNLKSERVQQFFNEKSVSGRLDRKSGGLAPKTLLNIRNMLNEAFTQACTNRMLAYNPVSGVKLPSAKYKEQRVLNDAEAEKLSKFAEASNHPMAKGIVILLNCGLRKGELLGLLWDSVNLGDNSIMIRKNLTRMRHPKKFTPEYTRVDTWAKKNTRTGLYLGPVKTHKGNRKVYLPRKARQAIFDLKSWQEALAGGASIETVNPMRFVLCNELGRPLDPKYFEEWFTIFVKDAGLESANIHSTRHAFATKALQLTQDINSVADILGHALPSTTLNMYGHTFDDRKKKIMEMFDY
ncbi:MAG: site-specific integrase [Oscillospiraceae bacterium]|nr:site-specific integrase [Oscillospiraceae bacterium]